MNSPEEVAPIHQFFLRSISQIAFYLFNEMA
jgi:hypothetical protein